MKMIDDIIVLIPSLDPDENLVRYVGELFSAGMRRIIIVNDGSTINTFLYSKIVEMGGILLQHAVNQGKGRALKTGINYILNQYSEKNIVGIVTADADGQHNVEDTLRVVQALRENREKIILGCRVFSGDNVPIKSSFGNRVTTNVFSLMYGKRISDTQTGLRGIPYYLLRDCLQCVGERFEYEIDVLIKMVKLCVPIMEIPIATIYYDSNRATHFSAIKDSVKIYRILLSQGVKFMFSSISSWLIDIILFALLTKFLFAGIKVPVATFWGTAVARIISCMYNFFVNKKKVFCSQKNISVSAVRYIILAACQLTVSWFLVVLIWSNIKIDTTLIKIIVDMALFFVSYHIQRRWVF